MNTPKSQGYVPPKPEELEDQKRHSFVPLALLVLAVILCQAFIIIGMGTSVIEKHSEFFMLLNGLLGLVIAFTNPHILFIGVASYLPFIQSNIDFELGVITLNPYSLGMILLTGLAFFRKLLLNKSLNLGQSDLFLALICGSFLISTVFAEDMMDSGLIAFKSIFIPVLTMFSARVMLDTPGKYKQFLRVFVLSLTIFGLFAIYSYLLSGKRAMPFNVQPIGTGVMLYTSVCLLGTLKLFPRILRYAALAICVLGMFVTYSRVLILVTLATPFLYIIIKRGKAFTMFLALFVLSIGITLGLVANMDSFIPDRYFGSQTDIHSSAERVTNLDHWSFSLYRRIVTFEDSLSRFMEQPIFGTGLQSTFGGEGGGTTQHNFNMEWLEYGGIVGYFLLVAFFLSHVSRVARAAVDDPILNTNLLILMGILCNAFFNGIFHGFNAPLAYLVMGLSEARLIYLANAENDARP